MLDHPADARIEQLEASGMFDPWAAEAEFNAQATRHMDAQNEADCAAADRAHELNPAMDRWFAAAEEEMSGFGDRAGPAPPEFYARGGPAWAATRPEPSSIDGKYGSDWLDGSDSPWDEPYAQDSAAPSLVEPEPRLADVKRGVGWLDGDEWLSGCCVPPSAVAPLAHDGRRWPGFHPPAAVSSSAATPSAPMDLGAPWQTSAGGPRRAFGGDRAQPSAKDEKLQRLLEKAGRIGLLGDTPGREARREGESTLVRDLRLGMLQRARETYDLGRLSTSLDWFEEFENDTRRHPIFRPLEYSGDIDAMVYNQETLDMFSEYIRRRGSRVAGRQGGDPVKSDTVATYVAVIKKLRTHEVHHAITDPSVNVVAPSAHKRMRQLDGPAGERRLSLGLRARHLRAAAELGFDRTSKRGVMEWGAALTAHNLLCRGGEVCVCGTAELDVERDLTLGAIEFKEPGEVSDNLPWLTAEFVPIKDTEARRRSAVMPVRRRAAGGGLGDDPMDTYDAIVLAMAARLGRMPPARGRVEGPEADLPLFVGPRGKPWGTADTRRLARRIASTLPEMDEALFGAKSFRIGGATDYRAVYGPEAAERMIKQRGRWWSDIHALYQRALAAEHLQGSAAIGDARGAELEALCKGWAQPANFR